MHKIFEPTVDRTSVVASWSSRCIGLKSVIGGILLLVLLTGPALAFGAVPPGNSVALGWDRSPDSSVTGYRVYYGTASGNYTNSLAVGNVTTSTIPGLASGVTYFFAVSAYAANGLESILSNEIAYTVPGTLPTVRIGVTPTKQVMLTVTGLTGYTYDILASTNLTAWTVIGTVTLGASGSLTFTDTNAASFPKRFYRTQQRP
jgi:hypothetical protein